VRDQDYRAEPEFRRVRGERRFAAPLQGGGEYRPGGSLLTGRRLVRLETSIATSRIVAAGRGDARIGGAQLPPGSGKAGL
jgi:hypothetical protein